ncbi:Ankyrin repeat family protein [Thalictrum thalictroides]|uniref:Ankyrin repeat family protein n=1 Tax=Thalictrum thalictroides TaxID=46969 RepID=A0A7J6UR54_THATH|nr:Ankyrin repeat family protein [Thalictrum thalictroides]
MNGQDNYGNTPLHIAALADNATIGSLFLYNNRVDKTIANMQALRAVDMIHFDYDKRKAGVYRLTDRVGEKEIKDQTDFDLLVGALIATVSFTAGITVPGGYTSDGPNKGTAILAKKISFKIFSISNTIALLLSLYAVFSHFCVKRLHKKEDIIYQLNVATYCSFGAIFAMVVAFITGSYAVLAVTEEFSITVCVLCCCFFIFAFRTLWGMIMQENPSFLSAWKSFISTWK